MLCNFLIVKHFILISGGLCCVHKHVLFFDDISQIVILKNKTFQFFLKHVI